MSETTEHTDAHDENPQGGDGDRDVRTEGTREGEGHRDSRQDQDTGAATNSEAMSPESSRTGGPTETGGSRGSGDSDPVDQAMTRLREADPGDTQEVLDAGNEANERLQERLRETAPE